MKRGRNRISKDVQKGIWRRHRNTKEEVKKKEERRSRRDIINHLTQAHHHKDKERKQWNENEGRCTKRNMKKRRQELRKIIK